MKSEKPKLGTYDIDKISLSCFDNKRHNLDGGIHTLAYFHKNSFTSCKEIEKDCNDWKRLWLMKRMVIIEKDRNYWRKLWSFKKIMVIEKNCNIWKNCDQWKRLS